MAGLGVIAIAAKTAAAWSAFERVVSPALLLAPTDFTDEIAGRLREVGVQDAVARRDTGPVFDWMMGLVSLQGMSDTVAVDYDARHGGITRAEVTAALAADPTCSRLSSYWAFSGCGYRKGAGTCAEPGHLPHCPLPRHPLRKGALNQAAYSLALFIRDVCDNDIVGWIDGRLAAADPGLRAPDRTTLMRAALLEPLRNIQGIGDKLWSMILAELLLVSDPDRERWVATGAS